MQQDTTQEGDLRSIVSDGLWRQLTLKVMLKVNQLSLTLGKVTPDSLPKLFSTPATLHLDATFRLFCDPEEV